MIALIIVAIVIILIITYKYPMLSLLLFLTTSLVKGQLMYQYAIFRVVDWTVLCTIYLSVAIIFYFIKHGIDFKRIFNVPFRLLLVLSFLLFFGVLYSSGPIYGFEKSSRFAAFGLISFLSPLVFGGRLSDIKKILWILLFAGLIIAVGTIFGQQETYSATRAGFLMGTSLASAGIAGVGSIIAFCFAMIPSTHKITKIIFISLIPFFVISILLTGSRGPFLGMILCWLLTPFAFRRKIPKMWTFFIFAVILIMVMYSFTYTKSSEQSAFASTRISRIFTGEGGLEKLTVSRIDIFIKGFSGFLRSPVLGHGTGAFGYDTTGIDQRVYPHNIILELLYENGVIAGAIICIILWLAFRSWRQAIKYADSYGLGIETIETVSMSGLIFTFVLLQVLKSGDINDARIMFFHCGLLFASYHCVRREVEDIIVESEIMNEQWLMSEEAGLQNAEVY